MLQTAIVHIYHANKNAFHKGTHKIDKQNLKMQSVLMITDILPVRNCLHGSIVLISIIKVVDIEVIILKFFFTIINFVTCPVTFRLKHHRKINPVQD